jgi:hypothetical protein
VAAFLNLDLRGPENAVASGHRPGGVVQSQVIETGLDGAGHGLRLVISGSQSHRTLSARFLSDFFG